MKKQLIAAVVFAAFSAAHAGEQQAYTGLAADALTTGAALATPGMVESNPLGWATFPIRMAIIEHAKTLPREEGQPLIDMTSASGWGAAANNLLALAGAGPLGAVVGVAVGYAVWKSGETEREFWHMCAAEKKADPAAKCEFRAWTPEEVTRIAMEQQRGVNVAQAAAPAVR
jgi:hypothetical protein